MLQRLTRTADPGERPAPRFERLTAPPMRRTFAAREHILRPGTHPALHMILSGMACRYALLRDGRRQFTALLLPGDVFGFESLLQLRCPDNIMSLTELQCLPISNQAQNAATIQQLPWESISRQTAVAREWMVNVGTRPALQRLAHFFCETLTRLRVPTAGVVRCRLPLTQVELADLVAMTPVHVNRSLAQLRRMELTSFRNGWLEFYDVFRLQNLAGFQARAQDEPLD